MTELAEHPPPELQLLHIPLADITPHPANPRHDVGDVADLAASIAAVGVLEPVLVCPAGTAVGECLTCRDVHPLDEDGDLVDHTRSARAQVSCPGTGGRPADGTRRDRWRLLAGHRRVAAARHAGLATVPALARPDIADDPHQLAAMLAENLQRVQLSPVEEAEGYDQLRLFGWSQASIAEQVGRSKATVSARLRLSKLPEATRARLHAHELTLDIAEKLAEFADDPKLVARLEQQAGTWNFDHVVQRARDDRQRAKQRAKTQKALTAAGVRVIDQPPEWGAWRYDGAVRPVADVVGPADLHDVDEDEEEGVPEVDWAAVEKQAVADHAACPHHAAFVLEFRPEDPVYVCTDPAAHPDWEQRKARLEDPTGPARAREETAEDRAAREAEEREKADLAAASEVRLTFLRGVFGAGAAGGLDPVGIAEIFRRTARHKVTSEYHTDDRLGRVLELLTGSPAPAKSRRRADLLAWIDAAPSTAHLARMFLAFEAERYELDQYGTSLRSSYGFTRSDGQGAEWLALLEQLGYVPSDFERSLVARVTTAAESSAGTEPADTSTTEEG